MAVALLVAAGSGERLGAGRPKAFVVLAGRPDARVVARRRLRAAGHRATSSCAAAARATSAPGGVRGVPGGATRSESVRAALAAAPTPSDVVVHDAARPLVTPELFAARARPRSADADCAIAAAPVTDTVKEAGARPASSRARSTARGCGRSRRRRRSAARRSSARSTSRRGARRRPPTTPGWSSARAGRCGSSSPRPRTSRSRPRTTSRIAEAPARVLTDYHVHLRPDERRHDRPSEYFTPANAERYRETATERGIAELGVVRARLPLHRRARRLGAPVLAASTRSTTSTPTASSCARRPTCGSASRRTSSPAARTGWPTCSTAASGTTWSARSTSCATARSTPRTTTIWGARRVAREGLAALLRDARRGRPLRAVRHHRPPRPGEGLGRRARRGPRATCAATTSRPSRRSPSPASPSRSRPPAAQAGRRDLPGARRSWRWSSTPAARSRCPATPTSPDAARLHGYDAGARAARAGSASREIASSSGRERRMEPVG